MSEAVRQAPAHISQQVFAAHGPRHDQTEEGGSNDRSADRDSASPGSVISEARYNAAGDVVGAIRQCLNAGGKPKNIYAGEIEAAASGLVPYYCDFGHWHVTTKNFRHPIFEDDKRPD